MKRKDILRGKKLNQRFKNWDDENNGTDFKAKKKKKTKEKYKLKKMLEKDLDFDSEEVELT